VRSRGWGVGVGAGDRVSGRLRGTHGGGALRGGAHGGGHMEGGTLFEGVAGHFWCVHQR